MPQPRIDPYRVLGVTPEAPSEVIQAAYRALARKFHPDVNPAGAEWMKRINEAHDLLSDPERRRYYDRDPVEPPVHDEPQPERSEPVRCQQHGQPAVATCSECGTSVCDSCGDQQRLCAPDRGPLCGTCLYHAVHARATRASAPPAMCLRHGFREAAGVCSSCAAPLCTECQGRWVSRCISCRLGSSELRLVEFGALLVVTTAVWLVFLHPSGWGWDPALVVAAAPTGLRALRGLGWKWKGGLDWLIFSVAGAAVLSVALTPFVVLWSAASVVWLRSQGGSSADFWRRWQLARRRAA